MTLAIDLAVNPSVFFLFLVSFFLFYTSKLSFLKKKISVVVFYFLPSIKLSRSRYRTREI